MISNFSNNVDVVMKERGFSIQAMGGSGNYIMYISNTQPTIACDVYLEADQFQLRHMTKRGLMLQSGMCGSILNETHFDRHLKYMRQYITVGD